LLDWKPLHAVAIAVTEQEPVMAYRAPWLVERLGGFLMRGRVIAFLEWPAPVPMAIPLPPSHRGGHRERTGCIVPMSCSTSAVAKPV